MPRKAFIQDLEKAQNDILPQGILDLQRSEDDGQFEFFFTADTIEPVKITALIPELSDYPKSHEYMIFSGEEAPLHIADALQNVRRTNGKTVYELVDIVSATLSRLCQDRDGDFQMPDSQFDDDEQVEEDDDDEDIYDSDHEAFQVDTSNITQQTAATTSRPVDRNFRARIRSDLRAAKAAGFKVGHHSHLLEGTNAYVYISIRVSKLGISDEAMEAWQVDEDDYLILILQYPNGYKTNEELQGFDSIRLSPNIGFRVCAGKKYKPTLQDAIKAFTVAKKNDYDPMATSSLSQPEDEVERGSIKDTFISKPLNALLQERLVQILRFRGVGLDWNGAEQQFNALASAGAGATDIVPDAYFQPEPKNTSLPDVVNQDHHSSGPKELSFPLLAMQFLLRHFVRCTEFCLVCHRKMDTEVEAIKPYVCDGPLCLYQYMSLGFGPSIEHEILAQPYVVDLLISFCYNSATARKLKEYPDGLSITVPPIDPASTNTVDPYYGGFNRYGTQPQQEEVRQPRAPVPTFNVGYEANRLVLIFFDIPESCPVRRGDWIVMKVEGALENQELHCRISDVTYFPTIKINEPVELSKNKTSADPNQVSNAIEKPSKPKPDTPAATPKYVNASFQVYCEDFKKLTINEKCSAICRLLDTLPNVKQLQEYLQKRHPTDLKTWVDRISPSALSLLRWIIASNRACIMQVDGDSQESDTISKQDRLYGMKDWMQFRFAMGAPDKEQRFINEVRKVSNRLALAYPTIFAWHGSPLFNWHMIIREGLHFKNVDHGRAYGHGVYHALDANTSTGYSGRFYGGGGTTGIWPNSVLNISGALALNEIVNAPAEFISNSPYYVVSQLDWIQTRYLLVQCAPTVENIKPGVDKKPQNPLLQDPKRIPRGINDQISVPASAIKSSRFAKDERTPDPPKNPGPLKKLKALGNSLKKPIPIDHDDSDATNDSDIEMFNEDPEEPPAPEPAKVTAITKPKGPATDFVPGSLDFSKLPLMPMPTYATTGTTKRLMQDIQLVQKVQDSVAPTDLGWSIDVEKLENVYQWIVELHSFHTFEIKGQKLPLVADMKKKGVKSIVLEMRFNKDYPFTPPYVRVIRPRFLSFNQGGGGHIVLGGAMCMELLTNTGWSSVSTIEAVLMQIRMAIASEPFARLDMSAGADYGTHEAADGYVRACRTHGWQVPPGFQEMAYGTGQASGSQY